MKISKTTKRSFISSLLIMFISMTCFIPMAQAAMIGTDQILDHTQAQQDRTHVKNILKRTDVAAQLEAAGVDQAQLQDRIDTLTDEEVALLADQFDQMPAGSGILGIAVFVFLVLLVTDILGYTDIFPFVKKTVK